MANDSTIPFAAIRAMLAKRLVALDKQPGTRPLGIGESWMRGVSKLVLMDCGGDAKEACGSMNLCAGLEAGIEGALHAVRKRLASSGDFEFEDWEVNDSIWHENATDGEIPPWEEAPLTQEDAGAAESDETLLEATAMADDDCVHIEFLGTGTSLGVPMIGCKCHVCKSEDPKDNRMRTSLLIRHQNKNIVIDCGPDFRTQLLRAGVDDLESVIITHEHRDHIAGLDDVRSINYILKKKIKL